MIERATSLERHQLHPEADCQQRMVGAFELLEQRATKEGRMRRFLVRLGGERFLLERWGCEVAPRWKALEDSFGSPEELHGGSASDDLENVLCSRSGVA